ELRVAKEGKSFREDEINKQRKAIVDKLDSIKDDIKHEKRLADKLRAETREKEQLAAEDLDVARDLVRQNQETEKKLEDVAREADKAPELKPLADLARELAKREMRDAESALK